MADIVTLKGNAFTPEAKQAELNEKQKSVVKVLEDHLARAKAGQYSECAVVSIIAHDDSIDTVTSDNCSLHYLISGLEILKFRLLENRDGIYRDIK